MNVGLGNGVAAEDVVETLKGCIAVSLVACEVVRGCDDLDTVELVA